MHIPFRLYIGTLLSTSLLCFLTLALTGCGSSETQNPSDKPTAISMDDSTENSVSIVSPSQHDLKHRPANQNIDTIKVVFKENIYFNNKPTEGPILIVNVDYLKAAPENIRAIIALQAMDAGTECMWEGKANSDFSNMACKLSTLLGLGFQNSKAHLGLVDKWFGPDPQVKEIVKHCYMTPMTATSQQLIDELILITNKSEKTVQAISTIRGLNLNEMSNFQYRIERTFSLADPKAVKLLSNNKIQ